MTNSAKLFVAVAPLPNEPARGRTRVLLQSEHARRAARLSAQAALAPPLRFEKDANDVPLPYQGWNWSVSHCERFVAGVVCEQRVGVDVESQRDARAEVVERVLSVGELALLGELTPQMFLRAWTAKEAVLKELGVGLGGLERCRIVALESADVLRVVCDGVERQVRQLVEPQFVVSVSRADGAEPVWLTVRSPISSAAEEHG